MSARDRFEIYRGACECGAGSYVVIESQTDLLRSDLAARLTLWPKHKPDFHLPLPFYILHATGAADKLIFDELIGSLGDLNTAAVPMGLHAACGVKGGSLVCVRPPMKTAPQDTQTRSRPLTDCITPKVVDKFSPPDNTSNYGARINPDAEGQPPTAKACWAT